MFETKITKKLWGESTQLYRDDRSGFHYIEIEPYGFSSVHKHENLANAFYVVEGKIQVGLFDEENLDDCIEMILLEGGQGYTVPKGQWHKFFNLELKSKVLEIYWTDPQKENDIVRYDEGGADWRKNVRL